MSANFRIYRASSYKAEDFPLCSPLPRRHSQSNHFAYHRQTPQRPYRTSIPKMYTQQPHVIDYSPCLTAEEFGEACHHLDNIYTRTDLGMLRRRWKLNVHNHFDLFGYQSYVSITLPVKLPDQQTGELADALERMNWSEGATQSHGMSIDHDAEMADSVRLQ